MFNNFQDVRHMYVAIFKNGRKFLYCDIFLSEFVKNYEKLRISKFSRLSHVNLDKFN